MKYIAFIYTNEHNDGYSTSKYAKVKSRSSLKNLF
jgi:hypothetical protein